MHANVARMLRGMRSTTLASGVSLLGFSVKQAAPWGVTSRAPIRKGTAFAGEILEFMQESVIESVTEILLYCALLLRIVTRKRSSVPSKLFIRTDLVFPLTLGMT